MKGGREFFLIVYGLLRNFITRKAFLRGSYSLESTSWRGSKSDRGHPENSAKYYIWYFLDPWGRTSYSLGMTENRFEYKGYMIHATMPTRNDATGIAPCNDGNREPACNEGGIGLALLRLRHFARSIGMMMPVLLFLLNFAFIPKEAKASGVSVDPANALDTIIDVLSTLSCETQGVGDLLRTEFSHTCIPAPFFTFAVANIVSPGLYANTLLRLKINDHLLFPDACSRKNRVDPNDARISFGLCNNLKLAEVRLNAIGMSAIAISRAVIQGVDPWDDIKDAWNIPKTDYHEVFIDKREGDQGMMYDLGVIPVFPWKIIKDKDRMCVATIGLSGWIPVGCKYIKEPFAVSMYANFMNSAAAPPAGDNKDILALTKCSGMGSCYQRAYDYSRTGIVMTGPLIECIREMTARLLVSTEVCTFDDLNLVINSAKRETSSFFQFQRNMHKAVTAFLTLYVIMFGFKIILNGEVPPKNELINFVLKTIFVIYFSVGINITPGGSDYNKLDGMVEWVFPFMLGAISEITAWVINASPSQLCRFDPSEYPPLLKHLAIWDSLDCRLSHYIGLDTLTTMLIENASRKNDFTTFDVLNFSIPPYFYLAIPALFTGSATLVTVVIMYPLLVISVGAYMLNATVVCMISIVILGVLAPIFVPMVLFEYTRGYFESWVKLMISLVLQPLVVATFVITMFSLYDFGFYGTCRYKFSEIESDGRATKIFYIDNEWGNYTEDDVNNCVHSIGYMLNNPRFAQYDFAKSSLEEAVSTSGDGKTESFMSKFDFLSAVTGSPGMFFSYPKVMFEKIKGVIIALITACFMLYLMYQFSAQLSEFAADMTESVSLRSVTINPQTAAKVGVKAADAAMKVGQIIMAVVSGGTSLAATAAEETAKGAAKQVVRKALSTITSKVVNVAKDQVRGAVTGTLKDAVSKGSTAAASEGQSQAGDTMSSGSKWIKAAVTDTAKEMGKPEEAKVKMGGHRPGGTTDKALKDGTRGLQESSKLAARDKGVGRPADSSKGQVSSATSQVKSAADTFATKAIPEADKAKDSNTKGGAKGRTDEK